MAVSVLTWPQDGALRFIQSSFRRYAGGLFGGYGFVSVFVVLERSPGCFPVGRIFGRCFPIANVTHQINEEIRDKEVRLINEDGEQLGVLPIAQAMQLAIEKELDLVKIVPGSNPPVCKLMDYGKYRFEQAKREKEARKNQRVIEIKEIRMSPGIGQNDFNVKLRNGKKFLQDGDRLKVTVRFRGREMAHTNLGEELLKSFAEQCSDIASMDKNPKLEGRSMSMFLSPKVQSGKPSSK